MKLPVPARQMLPLLGITVSAFVFNTSEFMPIALLMDISRSFSQTEAETGIMITVYAWMVAVLSLPLMLLGGKLSPKPLLLLTLSVFSIGQVISGLAPTFGILMGGRIVVASAHAIFWSVAAPLAARLVDKGKSPFALSMVATGTAVAMVFGLPLGRVIGLSLGWRMTFLSIAGVTILALIYLFFVFPRMENDESFSLGDLPGLFRNPAISIIFGMTLFFATSYFTTYSYIEPFLHTVAGFSAEGITACLMLVGASGFLGSFVFSKMFNG
jgi:MFS transporter, DHA1 family, L-arabinose/isopropyl-beta-D-thiogalactopyranoside export protein